MMYNYYGVTPNIKNYGRYTKMKTIKLLLALMLTLAIALGTFTSCDVIEELGVKDFIDGILNPDEKDPDEPDVPPAPPEPTKEELWAKEYQTITVAKALELCEEFVDAPSTDRYYIIATVKSVDNASYGQLTISDETGEIMVYGTYSEDGALKYSQMDVELKAGDVILIHGTLQNYKGNTKEVQNARLIDYYTPEKDPANDPAAKYKNGDTLTVAQAIEHSKNFAGSPSTDRYYITATVKSVTDARFGAMIIEDETGEISVYNSKNADGSVTYENMEDKPYKGDTVKVFANLQSFNGTPEIKEAYIVEFTHNAPAINPDDYSLSTIADARLAQDGTVVKVEGVVARITYATGMKPSGFYLIDSTNSIYVYDADAAGRVAIGNTVTVVGAKDHWILDSEVNNAGKFGYKGCNQITDVVLAANDNGKNDFDKTWITETTVKDIINTPVTEDITTTVYKVNALIKEVPAAGFTNFYFFDLDGETGSYAYTQCNGNDFTWLRDFDGKICTVYVSALNAKSTATDCYFRFIPVAVVNENYVFDTAKAPEFAINYHALGQFFESYTADPALELVTSVSSELLGFEGVNITYSSANEDVIYFTTADGKTVMHTKDNGKTTVTITATLGNYTYSDTVEITVADAGSYEYITVNEAINAELDSIVTVKGIVGPSLVNQTGFYLMDETGLIAVTMSADEMAKVELGQMVILEGKRFRKFKPEYADTCHGQTQLIDCTLLTNLYGNHTYSSEDFVTDMTIEEFYNLDEGVDLTTTGYVMKAYIYVESRSIKIGNKDGSVKSNLYASGKSGYEWLEKYAGQEVTLEIVACNWNGKAYYAACAIAIVLEDGTRVYNTYNFDKY